MASRRGGRYLISRRGHCGCDVVWQQGGPIGRASDTRRLRRSRAVARLPRTTGSTPLQYISTWLGSSRRVALWLCRSASNLPCASVSARPHTAAPEQCIRDTTRHPGQVASTCTYFVGRRSPEWQRPVERSAQSSALSRRLPSRHGRRSKAAVCDGRTTEKWLRSSVATWVRLRRSAAATTDASTVPRGRSR
jgi:hypothetical protein